MQFSKMRWEFYIYNTKNMGVIIYEIHHKNICQISLQKLENGRCIYCMLKAYLLVSGGATLNFRWVTNLKQNIFVSA